MGFAAAVRVHQWHQCRAWGCTGSLTSPCGLIHGLPGLPGLGIPSYPGKCSRYSLLQPPDPTAPPLESFVITQQHLIAPCLVGFLPSMPLSSKGYFSGWSLPDFRTTSVAIKAGDGIQGGCESLAQFYCAHSEPPEPSGKRYQTENPCQDEFMNL